MSDKYTEICTIIDVQEAAITVKTYSKEIWVNLGDGRFVLRSSLPGKAKIISVSTLYPRIRSVLSAKKKIVAKRQKRKSDLFFLEEPITCKRKIKK